MLALHNVTKIVGRGANRHVVLDNISWEIPPAAKIVILGHTGAGKTSLLEIMTGTDMPTSGWVERRGILSSTIALSRYGSGPTTPRQLTGRLAPLFNCSAPELAAFVESFADLRRNMDRPIRGLATAVRQRLNVALLYGMPCDYYLFDQRINFGPPSMRARAREVFLRRCEGAGMILVTSRVKEARELEGIGAILHHGKIVLFDTVEDAIRVFADVPPDPRRFHRDRIEEPPDEPDMEL
jgi:capsular polysaccharide transport system ATP-binding protein